MLATNDTGFYPGSGQAVRPAVVCTGHYIALHRGARRGGNFILTMKIRQPSHEFTFGVGISFIPYPLVLTPVV
jgi:hypothetical protein